MLEATLSKDGKYLEVKIPVMKKPSGSGKNIIVATTSGNKPTALMVDGKPLTVGVNAYISAQ